MSSAVEAVQEKGTNVTLLVIGFALSVLMPMVGFFVGLGAVVFGKPQEGVRIIAASVLVFLLWMIYVVMSVPA